MILGLSFGVYPNPLALKIASGEREPFIGERKRFEMKSAGGNILWYPILLTRNKQIKILNMANRYPIPTLYFESTH